MFENAKTAFEENFTVYYNKFRSMITGFIQSFVGCRFVSEELSQDLFVKLYERKTILDPDSKRSLSFLFTVARNMAIDYLRRKNNETRKYIEISIGDVLMDKKFYGDIEDCYLEGEIVSTLHDVIESFPREEQELFISRKFRKDTIVSLSRASKKSYYKIKRIEGKIDEAIRRKLCEYFTENE